MKTDTYHISQAEAVEIREAYANDHGDEVPEEVENDILEAAIDICRERARLFVIPAEWSAFRRIDGSITVKRRRN